MKVTTKLFQRHSISNNETSNLNPTEPQEPQTYCLKKLTEFEACLLVETEARVRLAKKMKQFNTNTSVLVRSNNIKSYLEGLLLLLLQVVLTYLLGLH